MKRQFAKCVVVMCLLAAAAAQATTLSITATTVKTTYSGTTLTMNAIPGKTGIDVEDDFGDVTTYDGGSFYFITTLAAGGDTSSGGIARGAFTGGTFYYKDSGGVSFLEGNIISFSLTEYGSSGNLAGEGIFKATGGTLWGDLGSGTIADLIFSVKPTNAFNSFIGESFTSSRSNITMIPEPTTIALLSIGALSLIKKRKVSL
jgi:hypothetical protein